MRYVEHIADLVGNTPLVRLGTVGRGLGGHRAGQGRVLQPRRQRQGPDRAAHDRGGRARRAGCGPAARSSSRPAATPASGWPSSPSAGLPVRVRLPGQGERGQAQRAAGLRRRGRGLPDRGAAGAPRLLLLGLRPAGHARSRRRLEARPVRQPGEPRSRTTRPPGRRSGSRPTAGSPTSSPASAPAARSAAPGATSRRSPTAGCRSSAPTPRARSTPAAPAGPTWSRASARTSGRPPTTRTICDRIVAVSDARLVRDDPPARPRGGRCWSAAPAGWRWSPRCGWPPSAGPDAVVVVLLPDGGRGYLSQGVQRRLDGRLRLPAAGARARRSATCCAARTATMPELVHAHPNETVADAIARSCASTACRRCRSCGPSRR